MVNLKDKFRGVLEPISEIGCVIPDTRWPVIHICVDMADIVNDLFELL